MKSQHRAVIGWSLTWIASAAMLGGVLWLVYLYGIRVPLSEVFNLVTLYRQILAHGFSDPTGLYVYVREQLVFVPIAFIYLLSAVTGVQQLSERGMTMLNMFGPVLSFISLGLVAVLVRHTLSHRPVWMRQSLVLLSAVLLYSLAQWESFSTSTFAFNMTTTCTLGAIVVLSVRKHTWWTIGTAALLCFCASFSIANGMMSWIVCIPLLLYPEHAVDEKRKGLHLGVWILIAGLAFGFYMLYFLGVSSPRGMPLGWRLPLRFIGYFFVALGSTLFNFSPSAMPLAGATGVLTCAMFPLAYRSVKLQHRAKLLPWAMVFGFGILTVLLIDAGRYSYGYGSAMSSRYATLVCPAYIALLAVLAFASEKQRWMEAFLATAAVVLAVQIPLTQFGIQRLQERSRELGISNACFRTPEISSDTCLGRLYFGNGQFVRYQADTMRSLGMMKDFVLRPNTPVIAANKDDGGWVDWLHASGSLVEVTGWALQNGCAAKDVVFTAGPDRELVAYTHTAFRRPDEDVFPGCKLNAGWRLDLDTERLPAAALQFPVELWIYDRNRNALIQLHSPKFSLKAPMQVLTDGR
ncbi:MAG TPA: hypothetical protein PKV72_03485 [Candidatus Peribacteria bacterium]|nr:hypothetical protein [Candidatus Peribacteria bacterium]